MKLFTEIEKIDILGRCKDDNYVELVMVLTAPFEDSKEHLAELQAKVQYYLEAINSEQFEEEFGRPSINTVRILVQCLHPPTAVLLKVIDLLTPQVEKYNSQLRFEYKDWQEILQEMKKR
ncbi:MAG: hypothetical protein L6R28_14950 [Planctomycetes bacterium]|nr:hypothetical protein [Planctomycetota bacterium]